MRHATGRILKPRRWGFSDHFGIDQSIEISYRKGKCLSVMCLSLDHSAKGFMAKNSGARAKTRVAMGG